MVDNLEESMFIEKVKNFDEKSGEADIIVTDGIHQLMCYCHPTEKRAHGTIVKEITALFATNIMRIDSQEYMIHKETDHYSYYLHGKVLDTQKPLVGVGRLTIKLDKPLAKDIEKGEFVEFKVHRLDCFLEKSTKHE